MRQHVRYHVGAHGHGTARSCGGKQAGWRSRPQHSSLLTAGIGRLEVDIVPCSRQEKQGPVTFAAQQHRCKACRHSAIRMPLAARRRGGRRTVIVVAAVRHGFCTGAGKERGWKRAKRTARLGKRQAWHCPRASRRAAPEGCGGARPPRSSAAAAASPRALTLLGLPAPLPQQRGLVSRRRIGAMTAGPAAAQ